MLNLVVIDFLRYSSAKSFLIQSSCTYLSLGVVFKKKLFGLIFCPVVTMNRDKFSCKYDWLIMKTIQKHHSILIDKPKSHVKLINVLFLYRLLKIFIIACYSVRIEKSDPLQLACFIVCLHKNIIYSDQLFAQY